MVRSGDPRWETEYNYTQLLEMEEEQFGREDGRYQISMNHDAP
jgi:hypothetical protein